MYLRAHQLRPPSRSAFEGILVFRTILRNNAVSSEELRGKFSRGRIEGRGELLARMARIVNAFALLFLLVSYAYARQIGVQEKSLSLRFSSCAPRGKSHEPSRLVDCCGTKVYTGQCFDFCNEGCGTCARIPLSERHVRCKRCSDSC